MNTDIREDLLAIRQAALQAVTGEPGISAFFIVLIATGVACCSTFNYRTCTRCSASG
jgi:hypothetical protein